MIWSNFILNIGDRLIELEVLETPIKKKNIQNEGKLKSKLSQFEYSVLFLSGNVYLVNLMSKKSIEARDSALDILKLLSNHFGYFEAVGETLNIFSRLWNVKLPELIYNSLFYQIKRLNPATVISYRKKLVLLSKFNRNLGLRFKLYRINNNNFGFAVDFYRYIDSRKSNPSVLLNPKKRRDRMLKIIRKLLDEKDGIEFYLGQNKFILKFEWWRL